MKVTITRKHRVASGTVAPDVASAAAVASPQASATSAPADSAVRISGPAPARALAGSPADRDFLRDAEMLELMADDLFLVRRADREYVLRRTGACDTERCRAACCAMICLHGDYSEYLEGFADRGAGSPVVRVRCRFLDAADRCSRWRAPNYPLACLLFPIPGDHLYLEVMDVCAFRFIVEADVTNLRERGGVCYEGHNGE
ncbi:MAG: hypothetical protein H0S85_10880 [Desulfovibrionaceae bacterium]|jgi:hypothetical protein|nr:hypothetical protein [Desulfovibrionaceae bacterium]